MAKPLPEFDQLAQDRRFLVELERLRQAGYFSSYRELALQLGCQTAVYGQTVKGKYHCNLRLLYNLARHYPKADTDFILFGGAYTGRPEPVDFPPAPELGRPVSKPNTPPKPVKRSLNRPQKTV